MKKFYVLEKNLTQTVPTSLRGQDHLERGYFALNCVKIVNIVLSS